MNSVTIVTVLAAPPVWMLICAFIAAKFFPDSTAAERAEEFFARV